jgi:hypothetical protein
MSVAAPLVLHEGDRPRLEAMPRSSSILAGLAQRARIVLLAVDGLSNAEIARRIGTSRPTVVDLAEIRESSMAAASTLTRRVGPTRESSSYRLTGPGEWGLLRKQSARM